MLDVQASFIWLIRKRVPITLDLYYWERKGELPEFSEDLWWDSFVKRAPSPSPLSGFWVKWVHLQIRLRFDVNVILPLIVLPCGSTTCSFPPKDCRPSFSDLIILIFPHPFPSIAWRCGVDKQPCSRFVSYHTCDRKNTIRPWPEVDQFHLGKGWFYV